MADKSSIEWTDATWNPVRGCSRISEGCRNCYAERQAGRFVSDRFNGFVTSTPSGPRWTGKLELVRHKLAEPLHWRRPRRIFVNSMSDLFHESLSDESIDLVFAVMAMATQHDFQVLTKRAERMRSYFADLDELRLRLGNAAGTMLDGDWIWQPENRHLRKRIEALISSSFADDGDGNAAPELELPLANVMLGVSCEDQASVTQRIPHLLATPAAARFVSAEPLLEPVNLLAELGTITEDGMTYHGCEPHLDWVIVGGESGPGARACDVAWVRSIVEQCRRSGVACFVKQLGAKPLTSDGWVLSDEADIRSEMVKNTDPTRLRALELTSKKGGNPFEWPEDLRVREFVFLRSMKIVATKVDFEL